MSEEQVCKEIIEQVGYQEFYRYFQEKTTLIEQQRKEIERLNNIINEFEEWLLGEQMMFYKGSDNERLIRYGETKNKWLELKGSEKE